MVYAYNVNGSVRTTDDRAPNTGTWGYDIRVGSTPPPPPPPQPPQGATLRITSFSLTPSPPVAGASVQAQVAATLAGGSGPFNGTVSCSAKIAGRALKWFGSVQRGRAACRWDIPSSAAGKVVAGRISLEQGAASAQRTFSRRVVGSPLARVVETWQNSNGVRGRAPTAGETFTHAAAFQQRTTGKLLTAGAAACTATVARAGSQTSLRIKSASSAKIDQTPVFYCKLDEIPIEHRGATLRVRLSVRSTTGKTIGISTLAARVH